MKGNYYRTIDRKAVPPLLPFLDVGQRFVEPCAGAGDLIGQLVGAGLQLVDAYDVAPKHPAIRKRDAFKAGPPDGDAIFITNPPWSRDILHPLIVHLSDQATAWLLFDAPWLFNEHAAPFMPRLRRVVATQRLNWIPGSRHGAKDDTCWYEFTAPVPGRNPVFFARWVTCD